MAKAARFFALVNVTALAGCFGNMPEANSSSTRAAPATSGATVNPNSPSSTLLSDFVAAPANSYVNKIKNLLTGLPATDAEIAQVEADPNALKTLIDAWSTLPQYDAKMVAFFSSQFQQNQASAFDFATTKLTPGIFFFDYGAGRQLYQNLIESFGRTALAYTKQGLPFNTLLFSQQFMMTTPLMLYYAYIDDIGVDDDGRVHDIQTELNPNFKFTLQDTDPNNNSSMTYYAPGLASQNSSASYCVGDDPVTLTLHSSDFGDYGHAVLTNLYLFFLGGQISWLHNNSYSTICKYNPPNQFVKPSDYNSWRMVTVRTPNPGEGTDHVWDWSKISQGNTLVLNTPRVGPFTTPSFFAQWATNNSNQARVTASQTLLTALGQGFDGTDSTVPLNLAALDAAHAGPTTNCYACHKTLDPMRQFFRQAYTLNFTPQRDPNQTSLPGMFGFYGVNVAGQGILSLGNALANHPRFALAWTEKLCTWARSAPCSPDDPEVMRVAEAFAQSHFSWAVLLREMLSSPTVTYAADSKTARDLGQTYTLASAFDLCSLLSIRLNIPDICTLSVLSPERAPLKTVNTVAGILPSKLYSRNSPTVAFAGSPGLSFRNAWENVCESVASYVVDQANVSTDYSSNDVPTAIDNLLTKLMGLDSTRLSAAQPILQQHYDAAVAAGASPTVALQSTFTLACLSPAVIGLGL